MAKYKIGDKVKVRSNLTCGKVYGHCVFGRGMKNFIGKEVTIEAVDPTILFDIKADGCYWIVEDNDTPAPIKFLWTDEMFEDIKSDKNENPMPKLTTGMFGRMYSDLDAMDKDGVLFVVVGDNLVYQDGGFDFIRSFDNPDHSNGDWGIDKLYEADSFKQCTATRVIWERNATDETPSDDSVTDDDVDAYIKGLEALSEIIKLLEAIKDDKE